MQEFQIEIKEELARVETIQAETLGEAIDKAMELYYDQKIILDAEDMKGVVFFIFFAFGCKCGNMMVYNMLKG